LPHLSIKHLHPSGGFTGWDAQYQEVNNPEMYAHDSAAFENYKAIRFADDVAKIRGLING